MAQPQGITDIEGIRVGVAGDLKGATGVTVILVEDGASAAVEVRGSAPGTRETDLLRPGRLVEKVQAIVLAGGSAFGLDAASGVVEYLAENKAGFPVGDLVVPIVPSAVLFDLFIGSANIRPDRAMGYQACQNASGGPVPEGSVGAGTGATVGKIYGMAGAVKAGQGSAAFIKEGLIVAALVVVNAFGDIFDSSGNLLAGPRNPQTGQMEKTIDLLLSSSQSGFPGNTTLGVVATNADLNAAALSQVCKLAHDGLARSIWPVHTMWDGDTIFALSRGKIDADINLVSLMAAEATSAAVERAVLQASSLAGIKSIGDFK